MATRRNFFKYLGLAGGVATGGVVAAAAVLPDNEKSAAIEQMERQNGSGLQFTGRYGVEAPKSDTNQSVYAICTNEPKFIPGTEKQVKIAMNVGPDGEMYLMTNGKWRRIVTE
jgi:hypothetical protein